MTQDAMEKLTWGATVIKHVWWCKETGKYHFSDEAEMLDETPYDTMEECERALLEYARNL